MNTGSRYRQTRTVPTRKEETFEVTEFEPDRRLSIQGALGPFQGRVTYVLEATENDTTTLTNTMELQPTGPLRLVARLAASRVESAVPANLHSLRHILERPGPISSDYRSHP